MDTYKEEIEYKNTAWQYATALRYEDYNKVIYWWNKFECATANLIKVVPIQESIELANKFQNDKAFYTHMINEAIIDGKL